MGEHYIVNSPHPYSALTPDVILSALDHSGFAPDGSLLALNSYENRVYAFRDHDRQKWVVKFYRPDRWSAEQLQEEHDFLFYLQSLDLPVIPPVQSGSLSLHTFSHFRFCVFPQIGGRAFENGNEQQMDIAGRTVGRLHAAAQHFPFRFREKLTPVEFAKPAVQCTLDSSLLPSHLRTAYQQKAADLLALCETRFKLFSDEDFLSCHGDMHAGNLLWRDEQIWLVDFDDARRALAIQDVWMLFQTPAERNTVIAAYEEFCEFDWRQIKLAEVMRALRMMQYTGWLAKRWSDPSFPQHFPWFATESYFVEQLNLLQQQIQLIEDTNDLA